MTALRHQRENGPEIERRANELIGTNQDAASIVLSAINTSNQGNFSDEQLLRYQRIQQAFQNINNVLLPFGSKTRKGHEEVFGVDDTFAATMKRL